MASAILSSVMPRVRATRLNARARSGRRQGDDIRTARRGNVDCNVLVRLHLPLGANFRDLTAEERSTLGAPGVQIGDVVGGTPAAKANLLEGDFVLKFNHVPVQDKPRFQVLLEQHMGQRVTLTIRRNGTTIERIVRLGTLADAEHKQ